MTKYIILTVLALTASQTWAQDRKNCTTIWDTLTRQIVYTATDLAPVNEGGEQALYRSIHNLIEVKEHNNTPTPSLKIAFIIEDSGVVSGGRVLPGEASASALAVLNVIRSFKWQPGRCAGKAVPVLVVLPLTVCYR